MKKRKIIKIILLIEWMLIIFLFSNQPQSGKITHSIIENIFPILKGTTLANIINIILRKTAHITEYFILTLLTYSLLKEYNIKRKNILLISILFCIFYSATDEYHQKFIEGRSSSITDCLIDSSGALIFIAANNKYTKLKKYKKKAQKNSNF